MRNYFLLIVSCCFISFSFAQPVEEKKELTILSWNIKFLPRFLGHIHHYPMKRVPLIAQKLIDSPVDIVVFQEAFDRSCNKKLKKLLLPYYPYCIGPANQKGGFKISSGVMIMSKLPIKELGTVDFKECEKEDCMARKGALLVETTFNGQRIQILGTHLEAGGGPDLKTTQYVELAGLLDKYKEANVPQLACGDFNTAKTNPVLYPRLLDLLHAEDGPLTGELQYTSDHALNDMDGYIPDDRDVIDYIFYRGNGVQPSFVKREVVRHTQQWHKKHKDLSDHFAVLMTIRF
jgi:endonuclease/exonuclease/phosphatase family metal-dependent hydrolase